MTRRRLGWLLVAGVIVRLVLLLVVKDVGIHTDDESTYTGLAANIVEGRGFAYAENYTTSSRPPLYPAFIAALWRITGTSSLQLVRAAQALMSLGCVVLLFALAREVFDDEVALIAAAALCFYPSFLYASVELLTEMLFSFLMLAGCLCATFALTRSARATTWAGAAGLFIGLAALTRSVLWPLPLLLVPLLVALSRPPLGKRLLAGASLALGFVLVVGPWAVRNARIQHTFVPVDTLGGVNLLMGNYEYTPEARMWDAVSLAGAQAWSYAMIQEHPDAVHWTEGRRERWARDRALGYMRSHPWTTLRRSVLKFADFWGLEREYVAALQDGKYKPPLWFAVLSSAVTVLAYVVVMILACIGLARHRWRDWRRHAVPLLMVVWICGIHSIVFGHSRYHLPLVPLLLMYAAQAIRERGWASWPAGDWRRASALAGITIFFLIWTHELFFKDPERLRLLLKPIGL